MAAVNPGTTSLIGYWPLEEASGTRVDSHTNSLDLTDNNTVTQTTGIVGNCAVCARANTEYLSRATESLLETGDIDLTISLWVNWTSFADHEDAISKWTSGQTEYTLESDSAGEVIFYCGVGPATATWGSTLSTSTWYNIVIWHDSVANLIGIAVNDGTAVTTAHSGGITVGTAAFEIGRRSGFAFDGNIDEVSFYKKVLTADNREWLYNGGSGRSYADLTPAGLGPSHALSRALQHQLRR